MIDKHDAVLLVGVAALAITLVVSGVLISGFGSSRAESQYTGQVVDIENEKGVVLQTTQANLKTNPRSSEHETFCIHPDNREQLQPLRESLRNGQRVTITYDRPLYVPVWTCKGGTSIITDIEVSNQTEVQADD